MSSIFIPGRGSLSWSEINADRAVKEYDDRLFFARNEETRDWCIFIRMPHGEDPVPLLGFGDEIPTAEVALERLIKSDTMRFGKEIYDDLVKSQEKYRAKLEYDASQASDEAVEPVEWLMRKHGKSPIIKSFSKGVSSNDA
jgi:hypothetical protein